MVQAPTLCSRCKKRLGPQVIRAEQKQFHPQCFICDSCKKPLQESFIPKAGGMYHQACHDKLFMPRCSHCGQPIQGTYSKDAAGRYHPECYSQLHNLFCVVCEQEIRGQYTYDHWGNKAHPEHEGIPTKACHVCARLLSAFNLAGGRQLDDGRLLCGKCHQSEIQSFQQVQQAKLDVIERMHSVGFEYIPDYIKIEFSQDQQLLNERMRASATGNIHGFTRTSRRLIPGYGEMLEHSISILSGLPRIAFMGVLAHELLHVWIHEQDLRHLSHAQVEGFCNLGTWLMYQSEDSELAQVLTQRMAEDTDPAYGDGYRAMAWRLEQLGWPSLIEALKSAQPLSEAPAERTQASPHLDRAPKPVLPSEPKLSQQAAAAQDRLQELKARLLQTQPKAAERPAPAERPQVSAEVADKVRERFARPSAPPKPPPKPPGGSKLGKLKRHGK